MPEPDPAPERHPHPGFPASAPSVGPPLPGGGAGGRTDPGASGGGGGDRPRELPTATEPARTELPSVELPPPSTDPPSPAEALRLIADASGALASSLDLDDVLAAVGHLVVPRFGDICVLDLGGEGGPDDGTAGGGEPRRCMMASIFDPTTEAIARDYLAR